MGVAKEQILMDQSFLAQPAVGRVSIGVLGVVECVIHCCVEAAFLPDTRSSTLVCVCVPLHYQYYERAVLVWRYIIRVINAAQPR